MSGLLLKGINKVYPSGVPAIRLHPPESQWGFRSSAISCINPKSGRWREPPIQSLPLGCHTDSILLRKIWE